MFSKLRLFILTTSLIDSGDPHRCSELREHKHKYGVGKGACRGTVVGKSSSLLRALSKYCDTLLTGQVN